MASETGGAEDSPSWPPGHPHLYSGSKSSAVSSFPIPSLVWVIPPLDRCKPTSAAQHQVHHGNGQKGRVESRVGVGLGDSGLVKEILKQLGVPSTSESLKNPS